MSGNPRVLVLDDEEIVCERLKSHLERDGLEVEVFNDSDAAVARLREAAFDVVVTDLKMKGPTGLDVLAFVRDEKLQTQVIIITGYGSIEATRDAEYMGAFSFVTKPFRMDHLGALVAKAAARARRHAAR